MAGKQTWAALEAEIDKLTEEPGFFQDLEAGPLSIERVSTGLTLLDHILGGGVPRGCFLEIMGPESSGKTTLAVQMCSYLQQTIDARCVYFDYEQSLNLEYCHDGLGLKLGKPDFLFSQPATMEQGFMALHQLIKANACDVVVWDTVAASRPLEELTRPLDASAKIAVHAATFGHHIQMLAHPVRKSKLVVIFVNQLRDKIPEWAGASKQEYTPGGRALKFYATVRLDVRRHGEMEKRKEADEFMGTNAQQAYGVSVRFRTVKNKTHKPFREVTVPLVFGHGYNNVGSVLDIAIKRKIIEQYGGGNFKLPGGKSVRGYDNLCALFEANPTALGGLVKLMGRGLEDETKCGSEAGADTTADAEDKAAFADSYPAGGDSGGGTGREEPDSSTGDNPDAWAGGD
jgi:recombination protein RecA